MVYNPYAALSIEQQRQKLPVFKLRNHILYLVENYQTVVIVGETGCGKSTQIPQYLAEAGWTAEGRVVGVTQPRRVAAVTVSFFSALQKLHLHHLFSVTCFFSFFLKSPNEYDVAP